MAGPCYILAILVLADVFSVAFPNELPTSCAVVRCGKGTVCKETARCVPTSKPGSCPKPKAGGFGICIARCSTDADCEDDLKCCGSCPRDCTAPINPIG